MDRRRLFNSIFAPIGFGAFLVWVGFLVDSLGTLIWGCH